MGTDIHGIMQLKNDDRSWKTVEVLELGRNYNLFAVLANVRNGFGFAGVKTSEQLPCISEPKGIPEDIYETCEIDEWGNVRHYPGFLFRSYTWINDSVWLGDHSHTWLTVKEIIDFDWDYVGKFQGYVSPQIDKETPKDTEPAMYCGGTSNKDWVLRKWKKPLYSCVSKDFWHLIEAYKNFTSPENARIVIGFDS